MNIPSKAIEYIAYQRTSYLNANKIYKMLGLIGAKFPNLHKSTVKAQAALYKNELIAAFSSDLEEEYEKLASFLPERAEKILDIGSGVAGIDVFLSKHYNHNVEIHLLDKTTIDSNVYYYFEEKGSFYNSLDIAKELLVDNDVPTENIFVHDTDNSSDCFTQKYDLITSFISWGFHYPLSTYLKQVKESLNPGGVLLLDIRKDTDGLDILQQNFKTIKTIDETGKRIQIAAS